MEQYVKYFKDRWIWFFQSLQREIDSQQSRNRQLERRLDQMEADNEEKVQCKLSAQNSPVIFKFV